MNDPKIKWESAECEVVKFKMRDVVSTSEDIFEGELDVLGDKIIT